MHAYLGWPQIPYSVSTFIIYRDVVNSALDFPNPGLTRLFYISLLFPCGVLTALCSSSSGSADYLADVVLAPSMSSHVSFSGIFRFLVGAARCISPIGQIRYTGLLCYLVVATCHSRCDVLFPPNLPIFVCAPYNHVAFPFLP